MVLASLHSHLHVSPRYIDHETHLQLTTGISADITPQTNLTSSIIVGPRTLPLSSSTYFPIFYRCIGTLITLHSSYASALQAMALFGLDFGRFPAMIGMSVFLIVLVPHIFRIAWKLTRPLSVRVPCSFLSITYTVEMPSTFSFSKLSCSTSTTPEKM